MKPSLCVCWLLKTARTVSFIMRVIFISMVYLELSVWLYGTRSVVCSYLCVVIDSVMQVYLDVQLVVGCVLTARFWGLGVELWSPASVRDPAMFAEVVVRCLWWWLFHQVSSTSLRRAGRCLAVCHCCNTSSAVPRESAFAHSSKVDCSMLTLKATSFGSVLAVVTFWVRLFLKVYYECFSFVSDFQKVTVCPHLVVVLHLVDRPNLYL